MKKTSPKKLTLSKESLCRLTEIALEEANGGDRPVIEYATRLSCVSCYRTCTC